MIMEEVHRWRGTAEQRALRPRSAKSGQFAYFDRQLDHPDWSGRMVLDFGGNDGSLLLDPQCAIPPRNYTCVDVIREALDEGRNRFPDAHWIHYDRYNCSFNPEGVAGLPIPDLGTDFGMILAYSVFTHTRREEMHDLVAQLRLRLAPGGVLAFTFIDPEVNPWPDAYDGGALQWRLEKFRSADPHLDVERLLRRSRGARWCALVDGRELYVDDNGTWDQSRSCMSYHVYYSVDFLRREFPGATIRPPVNGEMQHCCIITREM